MDDLSLSDIYEWCNVGSSSLHEESLEYLRLAAPLTTDVNKKSLTRFNLRDLSPRSGGGLDSRTRPTARLPSGQRADIHPARIPSTPAWHDLLAWY